jgi:group I intron endonuclease
MQTLQEQTEKLVIYKQTNNENQKFYVGSTSGDAQLSATELAKARFKGHCKAAKAKKKSKNFCYFQSAIEKYGPENFSLTILFEGFGTAAEKLAMEQKFLDELPRNASGTLDSTKCYNLSPIAGGGRILEDYSNHKDVCLKAIHEAFVAENPEFKEKSFTEVQKAVCLKAIHEAFVAENPEFKEKSFTEVQKAVCLKAIHEAKILEFPKLANYAHREVQAFCSYNQIEQIEIREAQTNLLLMICSSSYDVQEKTGTHAGHLRTQLLDQNFMKSGTLPAPLLGHKVRIKVRRLPPLTGDDLR